MQQLSLSMGGTGYQNCSDGHSYGPGIQWINVIHYILNGAGYLEVEGKKYRVEKGECFFFGAKQLVRYYPDMNDPWEYKWICFYGDEAARLIELTAFWEKPVCKADVEWLFEQIDKKHMLSSGVYNTGLIYLMFSEFIKSYPSTSKQKSTDSFVLVKNYVDANCTKRSFSVAAAAKSIGVERTYIYKLFREHENMSVIDYVINRRLNIAKQMLNDGYTQIKTVAFSVGYDNPLYFSNAFKKKFGYSPKNYIKHKTK